MLEYVGRLIIILEESKNAIRPNEKRSRAVAYNAGVEKSQQVALELYDQFVPKKLNKTHRLIDNDIIYG